MIAAAAMGDPNASIPTPQPVHYRPMFGAFGGALARPRVTFVSQAALENAGVPQARPARSRSSRCRTRARSARRDMMHNDCTAADRGRPADLRSARRRRAADLRAGDACCRWRSATSCSDASNGTQRCSSSKRSSTRRRRTTPCSCCPSSCGRRAGCARRVAAARRSASFLAARHGAARRRMPARRRRPRRARRAPPTRTCSKCAARRRRARPRRLPPRQPPHAGAGGRRLAAPRRRRRARGNAARAGRDGDAGARAVRARGRRVCRGPSRAFERREARGHHPRFRRARSHAR